MDKPVRPKIRRLSYLLLVLTPIVILALLEGALRTLDAFDPDEASDPFAGLVAGHRIFRATPDGAQMVIDRTRTQSFNPQAFPADKGPETVRIFCLGGSAAYGYPFGASIAFPHWLEVGCQTLWPEQEFEVINVAGMSYGSHRILILLEEILEYAPDLVVLYSGHNEFIERDFFLETRRMRFLGLRRVLSRLHLYQAIKAVTQGVRHRATRGRERFDPFGLDVARREGLRWSDTERDEVYHGYRENLSAIARRLAASDVPLLLMVPVPNVADWRPEHSRLSPDLEPGAAARWAAEYARGIRLQEAGQVEEALEHYSAALATDSTHAELHYRAGQCQEARGEMRAAARAYRRALDRDAAPVRIASPQQRALHALHGDQPVLFADSWASLATASPGGIPGSDLLWDYCHPNVRGHQLIAALACSVLVTANLFPAPAHDLADLFASAPGQWDLAKLGLPPPDASAVAALPNAAEGSWWLGNCAERQGAGTPAEYWYRASLEADPEHAGSLVGLAILRSRAGHQREAIDLALRALERCRTRPEAAACTRIRAELGVFYGRAGRMREAIRTLREVLSRDPSYPQAHANLARALQASDRLDEALQVTDAGLALHPEEAGLHRELGRIYRMQGRKAEAAAAYEEELRLSPGHTQLHLVLGDLYHEMGRLELAAARWEAAAALDPENSDLLLKLAETYHHLGREEEARRAAERYRQLRASSGSSARKSPVDPPRRR